MAYATGTDIAVACRKWNYNKRVSAGTKGIAVIDVDGCAAAKLEVLPLPVHFEWRPWASRASNWYCSLPNVLTRLDTAY